MPTSVSPILYLDLDGVLADFEGYGKKIVGFRPAERGLVKYNRPDWARISKNKRLYSELNVLPGALNFVFQCKQLSAAHNFDIRFLSAIPQDLPVNWAVWDKTQWVQKYFPGIPLFLGPYSRDKWKHCTPGDMLIDDRLDNIQDWKEKGAGEACHHTGDFEQTLEKLVKWTC